MKSLKILIEKTNLEINEQKIILNEFEEKKSIYQQQLDKLRNSLEQEKQYISTNPNYAYTFEAYERGNKIKQQNIMKQIKELDVEIIKIVGVIQDIFAEQKRYEIALDMKIQKQIAEEKKIEISELDEIANTAYFEEMRQKDTDR